MYLKQNFSSGQADYYGAITALDDVIGQLLKLLEELGIKNNTLFGLPVIMGQRLVLQM